MLKPFGRWAMTSSPPFLLPIIFLSKGDSTSLCKSLTPNNNNIIALKKLVVKSSHERAAKLNSGCCRARRRVRHEDEEEEDEEEYGRNENIAMLELYSESARGEALLVKALVDEEEVEVLVFKGMSSSLSYGTSPDPSKSVMPARAVIKSIDRIRGPFDPSNIQYLEKGLTWEAFKSRLAPTA